MRSWSCTYPEYALIEVRSSSWPDLSWAVDPSFQVPTTEARARPCTADEQSPRCQFRARHMPTRAGFLLTIICQIFSPCASLVHNFPKPKIHLRILSASGVWVRLELKRPRTATRHASTNFYVLPIVPWRAAWGAAAPILVYLHKCCRFFPHLQSLLPQISSLLFTF